MKELRRRGLSDKSDRGVHLSAQEHAGMHGWLRLQLSTRPDLSAGERPSVRTGTSDPPQAPEQPRSQLEVSRALNSEGLEVCSTFYPDIHPHSH